MKNGQQAQPKRGHQIFDLFPQIVESFEYIPNAGYNTLKRNSYNGSWEDAPKDKMVLEANGFLESGKRIEGFLPDLQTSFKLPIPVNEDAIKKASEFLPSIEGVKYIGIYTTSYSNAKYMSGWLIDEWNEFIKLINGHDHLIRFVFLGAEYDNGISQEVMKIMKATYINLIGRTELPVLIEVLKKLEMFVGFQSGLLILNEMIGAKQTVMLYSSALNSMVGTWADPKRIEDGSYKGCTFGTYKNPLTPRQLFNWLIENKKI